MNACNPWFAARNLLAVRLDNAGDVIMLEPALRAVKVALPDARITLLASPAGAKAAPLLSVIDDVLVWRSVWQDLGQLPFDPPREYEFVAELAARSFDAALIFTSFSQTPHVAGYVCYLAGIPLRAGESKEFGGATLTNEFQGTPDEVHQVERNMRLTTNLGFAPVASDIRLNVPKSASFNVGRRLEAEGFTPQAPLAVLHPGASARARRYPTSRLGAAARQLLDAGWNVVVTGAERERPLLDDVVLAARREVPRFTDFELTGFAALVERATVVVCGNTLPLHLADAFTTPVVALYSGTDLVSQWRPRFAPHRILRRSTPCTPCYRFDCPIGLPCLDVPPEEIVQAIWNLSDDAREGSLSGREDVA